MAYSASTMSALGRPAAPPSPTLTTAQMPGHSGRMAPPGPFIPSAASALPLDGSKSIPSAALAPGEAARLALDDVMDRFARGEDGALDELYRQGAPRVRNFLARLGGDLTLADDLTQDAFLRIHRARGSFVAGASALPWMLAIARNTLRDHARRERVRRTHQASAASADDPRRATTNEGGDGAAIARQTLQAASEALAELPERQREAFVLLRFEGLSLEDAAQVIGATEGAVKILVHRACVAIRATLDRHDKQRGRPR